MDKKSDEFWSDSSSDRLDHNKFEKSNMGFLKYEEKLVISLGIEETIQENEIHLETLEQIYAYVGAFHGF